MFGLIADTKVGRVGLLGEIKKVKLLNFTVKLCFISLKHFSILEISSHS